MSQTQVIPGRDAEVIYIVCKAEAALTAGDVVQWSDTDSATYPIGIAVEDGAADSNRLAGVVVNDLAQDEYGFIQRYGYNDNITSDGNVATTDLFLRVAAAVAEGATAAEMETDITTANILGLRNAFAWNVKDDVGTVAEAFIQVPML